MKHPKNSSVQGKNQGDKFVIVKSAYQEILKTVGKRMPESGGILLGDRRDFVVQKFIFDPGGSMSYASYDPDVNFLNKQVKKEWEENRLEFLGFIHSHPRGISRLSGDLGNNTGDLGYMRAIFKAMPGLTKFLVPILFSPADGGKLQIFPYMANRGDEANYFAGELTIIRDSEYTALPRVEEKYKFTFNASRLQGAVDIGLMRKAKVVCVGIGGANGICETLVRSGLGNIVLIDFDVVDSNNLVTQGYYVSDIGKKKVDALKERLLNINPSANVITYSSDFTTLGEQEENEIMWGADALLAMTDNFHAQAYANIIGLKYQVPTVFAMMYAKARACEVSFSIPGITPACHRCATSARYKAYNEEGYENDVNSTGSTNFHTTYLNSAIGLLTLAILHKDTIGFEFSDWFGASWSHNFLQLRISPFHQSRSFGDLSDNNERVKFFDSLWQEITPEAPPAYETCPDCGGTGDLRNAVMNHLCV